MLIQTIFLYFSVDVSRVILWDKHGKITGNHNDYINANFVDVGLLFFIHFTTIVSRISIYHPYIILKFTTL